MKIQVIEEEESPKCSYFRNPVLKKEFVIAVGDVFMRVSIADFESEAEAEAFCKSIVNKLFI
jgi:hypothetical protein